MSDSIIEPWLPNRLSRAQEAALQVAQCNPPPQQQSGFFRLSPEIRNAIYEMLIIAHNEALWVTADRHSEVEDIGPGPTPPPICQVSRLIRAETLSIYYGVNVFSVFLMRERNVSRAKRWIAAVGDEGAARMRTIRVRGSGRTDQRSRESVAYPGNCEDISVVITQREGLRPREGETESGANPVSAITVVPERERWQGEMVKKVVPQVQAVASSDNAASDGHPITAETLERVLETFAALCVFRDRRPVDDAPIQIQSFSM